MITSAHAHEGKTFTAANLALMLGESYRRRVLLIDGDLRRPCLHAVLGVPNVNGLADGLKGDRPVRVTELSQWLAVLPGGTPDPDPMPSLTCGRLKPIIEDAISKFDWVIIDTPPVALLPDASLLGSLVQGVILVVGAGLTPYRMIGRAVETLGRNKILGVVLNRVEANRVPQGSYDHYYGTKSGTSKRKKRFWNRSRSTSRP
jgi:capsular exopolysaccharide synthesis family protein